MMKINLNQQCLICETSRGVEVFNAYYANLGCDPAIYRNACRQPDGRMKMQL